MSETTKITFGELREWEGASYKATTDEFTQRLIHTGEITLDMHFDRAPNIPGEMNLTIDGEHIGTVRQNGDPVDGIDEETGEATITYPMLFTPKMQASTEDATP